MTDKEIIELKKWCLGHAYNIVQVDATKKPVLELAKEIYEWISK